MLRVPGTISKITTMADGGLRLSVDTQEIVSQDKAELMAEYNKLGHFVFSSSEQIKLEDIPTTPLEDNQKTPSQRLRAVMFVYWRKSVEGYGSFDEFYARQIEKYIELIKKKIDEL